MPKKEKKKRVHTQNVTAVITEYSKSAALPVKQDRFIHKAMGRDSSVAVGTTFTTNDPEFFEANGAEIVVGASHSSYVASDYPSIVEGAMAVIAGPPPFNTDKASKQLSANAAKVSAQQMSQMFTDYETAEDLKRDISSLVTQLQIQLATEEFGDITLAGGRAYPLESGFRFVGFHVGNAIIATWNPYTRSFRTISPAQMTPQNKYRPFPTLMNHREDEISIIDEVLEPGTIIFALSRGIHSYLPTEVVTDTEEEKPHSQRITLKYLKDYFLAMPQNVAVDHYLSAILDLVVEGAEYDRERIFHVGSKRRGSLTHFSHMGNEGLILGIRLPSYTPKAQLVKKFTDDFKKSKAIKEYWLPLILEHVKPDELPLIFDELRQQALPIEATKKLGEAESLLCQAFYEEQMMARRWKKTVVILLAVIFLPLSLLSLIWTLPWYRHAKESEVIQLSENPTEASSNVSTSTSVLFSRLGHSQDDEDHYHTVPIPQENTTMHSSRFFVIHTLSPFTESKPAVEVHDGKENIELKRF